LNQIRRIINKSSRIVFFGGAGVSTESGIADFRSAEGLYNQHFGVQYPPETVLSYSFFVAHPQEFFSYHKAHLLHPQARPNQAHLALAQLERQNKLQAVITQNVDGLHQAAGSQTVLELHGSVHRNYCLGCGNHYGLDFVLASQSIPRCPDCAGIVRPDVVLYEEPLDPDVIEQATRVLASADTLIVGGTSLAVYPAAGLIHYYSGTDLVLINKEPTPADQLATMVIRDPIGQVLKEFVE
jgi:NAD-dependent deacetylase